jgi:hypothetical protein
MRSQEITSLLNFTPASLSCREMGNHQREVSLLTPTTTYSFTLCDQIAIKEGIAAGEISLEASPMSEAPAAATYISNQSSNYYEDFLRLENTKYMGFKIHRKLNFNKYYKLFRTNPETNRIN